MDVESVNVVFKCRSFYERMNISSFECVQINNSNSTFKKLDTALQVLTLKMFTFVYRDEVIRVFVSRTNDRGVSQRSKLRWLGLPGVRVMVVSRDCRMFSCCDRVWLT